MPDKQRKGGFLLRLVAALGLGFLLTAAALWCAGLSPVQAWQGTFGQSRFVAWTLVVALPLVFMGLSMRTSQTAGLLNAGIGGQYIAGLMAAAIVGSKLQMPPVVHPLVVVLAAVLAGMLLGVLCGVLKAWLGVHEVYSGVLLTGLMVQTHNALAASHWMTLLSGQPLQPAGTAGFELLATWKASESGQLFLGSVPLLQEWGGVPLSWGLLAVLPLVLLWAFYLRRSRLAYEWRAAQLNPRAAYQAGIALRSGSVGALAWAGVFAGLAAALQWSNAQGLQPLTMWEGLVDPVVWALLVSMLAGWSTVGLIPAAWLVGALVYGGGKLGGPSGSIPQQMLYIFAGGALLILSLPRLLRYRISRPAKAKDKVDAEPAKKGV